MRLALLALVVVAGCGRFGFSDHSAATPDASLAGPDVAMFASDAPDHAADAATQPTPYAYFSMDDASTALLAADPDYKGTCTTCPTSIAGHLGNGLYFDSTAVITMSFQVGIQPYTIATWFSTNGQGTLLSKQVDNVSVDNVVNIAVNNVNELVYETFDGANPAYLESMGAQIIGGWHHVAITWDGATKSLYIDGLLAASSPATLVDADFPLVLGTDIDNGMPDVAYTGALDELRFYKVVLDAAQIAALANQ